ncbi:ribosome-recycling factor [Agaricicola taiwanensis]|uniref:Ribosome-recycling factor n=2 Tax=Agaricicola taiwanensis TaxID=591372 RepID=A0A8J2YI06_9RHOB|nr:ribosome-recycling factor [Agaricicola taiwanensis]
MAELKRRMNGAIAALKQEFSGLRTGRASINMLDPVMVDAYGSSMPLNQVATVSVPEARMLVVQVWDRSMAGAVDKAIRDANLGLNPVSEGQVIRVPIPELNAERRAELVKVAHKYAENARIAVRHVRRDGLDNLKRLEKDGQMSQDEQRHQADLVQKTTDEIIAEIDQALATKEKEIMQV